ncbi:2-octaprenyl-6-methoxyphenyl hydroxylase [Salinisphaera hydrothermalis]|uniref:2-polyprenyl-6-methoxyphenol 4-hydroxylase n=1 Tax=Salinisphaera hydrothermalis (strain C41B8) TaxID=1304275 RepID=A0A084ILH2_SALHC|nr:2-octaprenyl-6-methoxyphenyl hydroxylase [Salinisphaera hydrothermalis]KEZ77556.1 2-polyprenyl-6-methoxyphenol 4-hydroxylase [Salinisphaera hydrothermalis C41B8]
MSTDYDIAVVGGGLAGASLACALSDSGLRIALIETVAFDAPADENMKARTTALAWGTRAMFDELGLWSAMAEDAAAIERLHVSQAGHFGRVTVAAAEYGLPALGYVVPNLTMIAALRDRVATIDGVDTIAPATFESLAYHGEDAVELTLAEGEGKRTLTTRLVIGADGTHSRVRSALGIGATVDDYGQSAIITKARSERPLAGCAYERFTPDGPVAILPFLHDTAAVVWTVPTDEARRLLELDDDAFTAELQARFGDRLGQLELAGPRGAYPLARVLCDRAWSHRAALIGNAGHALHPAAAQGFNLAIRDALGLADNLREHQRLAGDAFDPGDADRLAAWAESRRPDQHRVANFTDRIVRLFSNRVPGLGHARGAGLFGLSLAPGVRGGMARRSMGLALLDDVALRAPERVSNS